MKIIGLSATVSEACLCHIISRELQQSMAQWKVNIECVCGLLSWRTQLQTTSPSESIQQLHNTPPWEWDSLIMNSFMHHHFLFSCFRSWGITFIPNVLYWISLTYEHIRTYLYKKHFNLEFIIWPQCSSPMFLSQIAERLNCVHICLKVMLHLNNSITSTSFGHKPGCLFNMVHLLQGAVTSMLNVSHFHVKRI